MRFREKFYRSINASSLSCVIELLNRFLINFKMLKNLSQATWVKDRVNIYLYAKPSNGKAPVNNLYLLC